MVEDREFSAFQEKKTTPYFRMLLCLLKKLYTMPFHTKEFGVSFSRVCQNMGSTIFTQSGFVMSLKKIARYFSPTISLRAEIHRSVIPCELLNSGYLLCLHFSSH